MLPWDIQRFPMLSLDARSVPVVEAIFRVFGASVQASVEHLQNFSVEYIGTELVWREQIYLVCTWTFNACISHPTVN